MVQYRDERDGYKGCLLSNLTQGYELTYNFITFQPVYITLQMPQLIDTHCHLDLDVYSNDREKVIQQASSRQVIAMILPATTSVRWKAVRQIASEHLTVYPAYGLHPCFMDQHSTKDIELLGQWLKTEAVVAVGECGLDFHDRNTDRNAQIELFEAQLALAQRHQLPVIIHARKSVEEVIARLKRFTGLRSVLHSYSGSYEQARQLMDLGCYFGFGGPVTWSGSTRLQALVKKIPLENILLETDSPDQSDQKHRYQRNEPAFLLDIADFLSSLRAEPLEKLAIQTSENARILFSIY